MFCKFGFRDRGDVGGFCAGLPGECGAGVDDELVEAGDASSLAVSSAGPGWLCSWSEDIATLPQDVFRLPTSQRAVVQCLAEDGLDPIPLQGCVALGGHQPTRFPSSFR